MKTLREWLGPLKMNKAKARRMVRLYWRMVDMMNPPPSWWARPLEFAAWKKRNL